LIYNIEDNSAWINASGDGVIVCNGEVNEIDQHNMPDYLAYHLDLKFEDWYNSHTQKNEFSDNYDTSISTDGISKLKPNTSKVKQIDTIELFLKQKPVNPPSHLLSNLYSDLIENQNQIAFDHMSIIRIIL
jgi:hypothetical protein